MPSMSPIALALAAGASLVSAHGFVSSWEIGGVTYKGFDEQWALSNGRSTGNKFIAWGTAASDNGFVGPEAYSSPDIVCHRGATNGLLNNATVAAGGKVKAIWNTWPDSHHGPVIDYLAPADDPTSVDKTSLSFVKIGEAGVVSGSNPGVWASDEILKNGLAWEITIPEGTPAGNYVLRHEIIALHSANQANGAQNYPQCVNIQVTGGGSSAFPAGTKAQDLYKAGDKGIHFNIYEAFTSYPIPGPALGFSGASSTPTVQAAVAATTVGPDPDAPTVEAATVTKNACKERRHARDLKA